MITLIAFSAAMGWCGTPYPGWWRRKKWPNPPPPDWFQGFVNSNPMPGIVAGIIGGIGGGLIMNAVTPDNLVLSGMAALAGGRILGDIAGALGSTMK